MIFRLEQLVYGSFPFWDRGYDVLARSPGMRDEWASEVLAACRRFGEAPSGVVPEPSLFALRLPSGPWAVVGAWSPGADDRGRPGALAFHALIVPERDYRRGGSNPFAYAGALRRDWSAGVTLDPLEWRVAPHPRPTLPKDLRAVRAVQALAGGRKVAVESAGPIDGFARQVWLGLPASIRSKSSMATWAFGVENGFDLVAVPRLSAVELDSAYLVDLDSEVPEPARRPRRFPVVKRVALTVAVALGTWLAWRAWDRPRPSADPTVPAAIVPEAPVAAIDEAGRSRVMAGLLDLADRFEAFEVGTADTPAGLMARFSGRVRYRGPTLSDAELARLRAEHDPDRDRALAWHGRIRAFVDDRPVPADFDRLPLDRQLGWLARSYHLEPPGAIETTPEFLADSLSRSGPISPTPLASRYPALSDYAGFLRKLPRVGPKTGR